ncbi:DEAD/DEAH box helicase [Haloferula sp. BvORR071]|uniref:DEAD/DEAH box helicase n=1 Tax=Haloferula sp. BvORR071 TaxID=1396141 RepID=UPI000559327F|nr:DEAD/DEAH box helicase [Haloferula sp. BvORR071]
MIHLDPSKLANPNSNDEVLSVFLDYLIETDVEPYDHQEQAILELFAGNNVILNTPTGSGKSLVAMALQFKAICQNRRSYYTVPIKALANEKFLSLCHVFGPEKVGMITGDATVNPGAPVICCTAEILANLALREGAMAQVDDVIMDEFHYYSDHSRGFAWQVPLLTLPQARFLLMSATLGETAFFEEGITKLTGVPTVLVKSDQRPVPLEFDYSETPLEEKVAELVEKDRAPIYLVHFTQLACAQTAQNLTSSNFCTKEEKQRIAEVLHDANFRSPYGKEVSKLLRHGIGIHHAGLLPKYRILVEKLAQRGLLKVICGTDTLGVGVNVPIRTVLFTQLFKYDGSSTKTLTVRDFKQICGRAGRRGFDNIGYVVCQAPEHVIENVRLEQKAAKSGKKSFVKRKPPEKGFVNWDEKGFRRLMDAPPEKLVSSFQILHSMLLNVLGRQHEDGCAALRKIINDSHETAGKKKAHRKRAFQIFRGMVEGNILRIIPRAERHGPVKVALNVELQEDFSMNQALGLYLLDAIPLLDREAPDYALNVISLVEAILENPEVILRRQVDMLKGELINQLKNEGVEYEERMARLEEVEWPKPGKDFIYDTYNRFVAERPWMKEAAVRPKSIAREIFEHWQSFEDYVKTYGLERSEAVLLRHISEVYKVLSQTVPPMTKTEELVEAEEYLGDLLRTVDSSLIDEWEKLRNPDYVPEAEKPAELRKHVAYTRNRPAFTRALRNAVFTLVKAFAEGNTAAILAQIEPTDGEGQAWNAARIEALLDDYYSDHERIRLDPEARATKHSRMEEEKPRLWTYEQILVDPEEHNDWSLHLSIDLDRCDAEERPVLQLVDISRFA